MPSLHREQWLARPVKEVFEFFSDAYNLEALTPPLLQFQVLTPAPIVLQAGALIDYKLRIHGLPLRWRTRIDLWNPPYEFVDLQLRGPYKLWRHRHTFLEQRGGTTMIDHVDYELPFGPLGRLVHAVKVRRDVETIFDYRAKVIGDRFA